MFPREFAALLSVALFAMAPAALAEGTQCINDGFGREVCGFGCTVGGDGHGACGRAPGSSCINDGFGHATCGFSCIVDGFGHGVCANTPNGTCGIGGDGHGACTEIPVDPYGNPMYGQ